MAYEIEYFHERVLAEIESWSVDVLADYARLLELLAGRSTASLSEDGSSSCTLSSRRPSRHPIAS